MDPSFMSRTRSAWVAKFHGTAGAAEIRQCSTVIPKSKSKLKCSIVQFLVR